MSTVVAVTNTIAFVFPDNAAQPTLPEMVRFVKGLNGAKEQMDTAYKNAEERTVFIKYKTEEGMKEALSRNEVKQTFHYSNGKQVEVFMSVAGSNIQYVRVFDLPPEVSDNTLAAELKKFGSIKRCVREKYPVEFELDLFTGVRGVYMDVDKEIPPVLNFLNRRGRIFYRGSKLICFACGQEGHLKKSCGKRKGQKTAAAVDEDGMSTFAAVLAATNSSDRKEQQEEESAAAAAASVDHALSDDNLEETENEEEIVDEVDNIEMDQTPTGNYNRDAWHRIATCIEDYKKTKMQKAAEEQRKQAKKTGARTKTGASPPVKKTRAGKNIKLKSDFDINN